MLRTLISLALAALFLSYATHVAAQMNVSKRPSILSLGVAGVATPQTNLCRSQRRSRISRTAQ